MKVLALTHAHLKSIGLSPVSCERADSLVGVWADKLNWDINVVHTQGTEWRGIWPDGKGLKINIINEDPPTDLWIGPQVLFAEKVKEALHKKQFTRLIPLVSQRLIKRLQDILSETGWSLPRAMIKAKKWGNYLCTLKSINSGRYDFIFVCVGQGDEYILETAHTLSANLHIPMVVDFRDLWSEHHEANRFTPGQRKIIRKREKRLLRSAVLLSVPQQPMAVKLKEYLKIPVHLTPHGAYTDPLWEDGNVIKDEFRMLYAGKIYPGNPGLILLFEMIKKLGNETLSRPVKCHFYVDDTFYLCSQAEYFCIKEHIVIHNWVTPAEIWKQMRSSHLLLIFDGGFYQSMHLVMTKTYQYASTGRPILVLSKYGNSAYEAFFSQYKAGFVCRNTDEAVINVIEMMADPALYESMPELRKVPSRRDIAVEFGSAIENSLKSTRSSYF